MLQQSGRYRSDSPVARGCRRVRGGRPETELVPVRLPGSRATPSPTTVPATSAAWWLRPAPW